MLKYVQIVLIISSLPTSRKRIIKGAGCMERDSSIFWEDYTSGRCHWITCCNTAMKKTLQWNKFSQFSFIFWTYSSLIHMANGFQLCSVDDTIICFLLWQKGRASPKPELIFCHYALPQKCVYTSITAWNSFCQALELSMCLSVPTTDYEHLES